MTDHPIATAVTIPVKNAGAPFLPIIVLSDEGICKEFLRFITDEAHRVGASSLDNKARTIARFLNFWSLFICDDQLDIDAQTQLIFAYLDYRLGGTEDLDEDHILKPLDWAPVAKTTVRNEFRTIIDFLGHIERNCEKDETVTVINKVTLRLAGSGKGHYKKYLSNKYDDFLIHTKKSRKFWAEIRGAKIQLPVWARPKLSGLI